MAGPQGRGRQRRLAAARISSRGRANRETGRRIRPGRASQPRRRAGRGYPGGRGGRALGAAYRAELLELTQRRVLGPDHPDCLASRQHLARLAGKAGRYAEAEQMYRQVLADRRRVLGASHPDTVAVRNELAQAVAP